MVNSRTNIRSFFPLLAAGLLAGTLFPATGLSQVPDSARWRVYLTATDSVTRKSAKAAWGFHPRATLAIDPDTLFGFKDHWYESDSSYQSEYPSPPLGFFQELRINNIRQKFTDNGLLFGNIHGWSGPTMIDTFIVTWNGDANQLGDSLYLFTHPQILSWPSVLRFYADSIILRDISNNGQTIPGSLVRVNMTQDSTWTYRGDSYFNPDISIYTVDPVHKGFFMYVYHPKISASPPAPVTLTSPADGATGQPSSLSLQWDPVPGAFFYKVQLDTSRKFTNPLLTDSIKATSRALTGLLQNTWYYWRVLVGNPYGVSYYQAPADSFKTTALTPLAPPIISPAPGAQNVSSTPTFAWGAGLPPLTYEVQLSKSASYSPLLQDTTLSDTSVVFPTPLSNCLTYFWRVRGHNVQGYGPFSSASFSVSFATPAVPIIVQYPDSETNVPANATLIWTGRDDCSVSYRVQVALDPAFVQLVLNTTVPDTSVVLNNLLGLTTYYWRVRAENPGPLSSAYTATRIFTTAQLPPSAPVPLSPANGSTTASLSPTLVWSRPFNNPTGYRLQVDIAPGFPSPVVDDSTLTDTSRVIGPLAACTKYYWRVRAKNAIGTSAYSSTFSFNSSLQPPAAPTLVSPPDGALNQPTAELLTWTQPGLCAVSVYVVQLSLDTAFSSILRHDTVAALSKLESSLNPNTKYFWRIVAVNDSGSALSAVRAFTTTSVTRPPVPVLLSPGNGAGGLRIDPFLIWDTSSRATSYHLQVAYDAAFSALAFDDSTLTTTIKQVGPLLNSTTYYWHVSAKNDSGPSAYSAPWSFTTLFPPAAPLQIQPGDGAVDVPVAPTFVWTQPSGAETYQLQVSKDQLFTNFFSNDSMISGTSWVLGRTLVSYTRYYWRIRASNAVGWGPFSSVSTFRTSRVGAANWLIPLAISETGPGRDTAFFGISPMATAGIDPALGEYELPPMTNNGLLDIRFVDTHAPYQIGEGLRVDYLPFSNYYQVDTFKVRFQPGSGTYPMRFSWPAGYIRQICDSIVLTDEFGGVLIHVRMDTDSSLVVSNTSISSLLIVMHSAFPITGVKTYTREIPHGFALSQNYPNPFNPSTRIEFSTDHPAHMRIAVYDVLGRRVASLSDADYYPGVHAVSWNGSGEGGTQLPSGIYYARMLAERLEGAGTGQARFVSTIKMLMIK